MSITCNIIEKNICDEKPNSCENKIIDLKIIKGFREEFEKEVLLFKSGKNDFIRFFNWFFPDASRISESSRRCFRNFKYSGVKEFDISELYEKVFSMTREVKEINTKDFLLCLKETGRSLISQHRVNEAKAIYAMILDIIKTSKKNTCELLEELTCDTADFFEANGNIGESIDTLNNYFKTKSQAADTKDFESVIVKAKIALICAKNNEIVKPKDVFFMLENAISEGETAAGDKFVDLPELYFQLGKLELHFCDSEEMLKAAEQYFKKAENILIGRYGKASATLINFYEGVKIVYFKDDMYVECIENIWKLLKCRALLFGEFSGPVKWTLDDGIYNSMLAEDIESLDQFMSIKESFRKKGIAFQYGRRLDHEFKGNTYFLLRKYAESLEEYKKVFRERGGRWKNHKTFMNMAQAAMHLSDYNLAKKYFARGLKIVGEDSNDILYFERMDITKTCLETGDIPNAMRHAKHALKKLVFDVIENRVEHFNDLYLNYGERHNIDERIIYELRAMNDIVLELFSRMAIDGLYDQSDRAILFLLSGVLLYKAGDIPESLSAFYNSLDAGSKDPTWEGADDDVYIWSLIIDCMSYNEDYDSAFQTGVKFLDERLKDMKKHLAMTASMMFQCGTLALRFGKADLAQKYFAMAVEEFEQANWNRNSNTVKKIIDELLNSKSEIFMEGSF